MKRPRAYVPFTFDVALLADDSKPTQERDAEWARVHAHFDPRLRDYFQARCRTESELDDLISDLWRRVFLHIGSLSTPAAAWSWMVTIGRNVLSDMGRAQGVEKKREERLLRWNETQPAFTEPDLTWFHEDLFEGRPGREVAMHEIAQLPAEDRALLALAVVEERPHDEIARMLRLPSAAASRKRLHRLRQRLLLAVTDAARAAPSPD